MVYPLERTSCRAGVRRGACEEIAESRKVRRPAFACATARFAVARRRKPDPGSFPPKMPAAPAPKPAGLSVFFPAYNDSGTIASMVIRAVQAASELTPDYEVIVVNDGSSDATAEIADELARA